MADLETIMAVRNQLDITIDGIRSTDLNVLSGIDFGVEAVTTGVGSGNDILPALLMYSYDQHIVLTDNLPFLASAIEAAKYVRQQQYEQLTSQGDQNV